MQGKAKQGLSAELGLLLLAAGYVCDKCARGKPINYRYCTLRSGKVQIHRVMHLNKRGHCYAPCAAHRVYQMILDRCREEFEAIPEWGPGQG